MVIVEVISASVILRAVDSEASGECWFEYLIEEYEMMVDDAADEEIEDKKVGEIEIGYKVTHVVVRLSEIESIYLNSLVYYNQS